MKFKDIFKKFLLGFIVFKIIRLDCICLGVCDCGLIVCFGVGFRVVGGLDIFDKVERIEVDKKDKLKVNRI